MKYSTSLYREAGRRDARRTFASFYREVAMPSSSREVGRRAARFTLRSSVSRSIPPALFRDVTPSRRKVGAAMSSRDVVYRRCIEKLLSALREVRFRLCGAKISPIVVSRSRPPPCEKYYETSYLVEGVCVSVVREVAPRHARSIFTLFVREVAYQLVSRSRPPRCEKHACVALSRSSPVIVVSRSMSPRCGK